MDCCIRLQGAAATQHFMTHFLPDAYNVEVPAHITLHNF